MLSNPRMELSAGSSVGGMSMPRRSRTALAYSVRFRRCGGMRPALGAAAAARSRPVFEKRRQARRRGRLRPRPAGRRHRTGPQHVGDLLPRFRRLAEVLDVDGVEHEPGRLGPLVVARDAVLIKKRALLGSGRGFGSRRGLRGPSRGACVLQPCGVNVVIAGAHEDESPTGPATRHFPSTSSACLLPVDAVDSENTC